LQPLPLQKQLQPCQSAATEGKTVRALIAKVSRPAILLMFTSPCQAVAQDAEIVVRGSALPDALGDAAYDIVTIRADRLNTTASGRIEDTLRDVAGLQQFRRTDARSANATSQGATLRGLGGNASSRALLVLDGVPQSDPFGGWVTWPAFAPERLHSIRVTRGGGSGAYGSGALAGTIEMESIGSDAKPSASAAFGSRNGMQASGLLAGKLGAGFGFVDVNFARGNGFIPINSRQRGPADSAAPYRQASLAARAVIPIGTDTELQVSTLAFTDRRTRGTILSANGGDGADANARLVHTGNWGWQALAYVQMRKFRSRFVAIDAPRATVTQTVNQYNVPSTGIGARFEVRPPVGDDIELRIGGDWRRTVGETKELFTYVAGLPTRGREAGGSADTLGGFAELSAKLGNLTLTGGGKADHWSLGSGRLIERTLATGALIRNEQANGRSGWEGTGRAGAAFQAGDLTLRSAAYLGWRLPTLNELYRPFRVGADATAANAALNPERMRGGEIGFGWSHRYRAPIWEIANEEDCCAIGGGNIAGEADVQITVFSNRLTSAIANVSLGRGSGTFPGVGFVAAGGVYRQRLNVDAIRSRGIELDANYSAGDWHLSVSYAYTDARVRASGIALPLNGLRPAQVPQHMQSATLGWRWISATARYVSSQFEDDQNSRRLKGALTLDGTASIPISEHLSATLRAENLANTQVDAAISATGIIERASPRAIWLGLTYR
jgi:vitamin B12 transporter